MKKAGRGREAPSRPPPGLGHGAHSILYDRIGTGELFHLFTRSLNGVFFEVLERRGGYDRYGEANAAVRLASQAMLDQTPSEALTAMRGTFA